MNEFSDRDSEVTGGTTKNGKTRHSEKPTDIGIDQGSPPDTQEGGFFDQVDSAWEDEHDGLVDLGSENFFENEEMTGSDESDEDDDFIELLELSDDQKFGSEVGAGTSVSNLSEGEGPMIELTDVAEDHGIDDPVIELTEIVEIDDDDDTVIELTEIAKVDGFDKPDIEQTDGDHDPVPLSTDGHGEETLSGPTISGEQLESALIKVIQEKYSETIEQLLLDSVQNVVEDKIKELKQTILNDLGGMPGKS